MAVVIWIALAAPLKIASVDNLRADLLLALVVAPLAAAVLLRFGLLSFAVMLLVSRALLRFPVPFDFSAWFIATSSSCSS